ncbi:uncharacterized protein LOC141631493 [Silene latifolia]|uniref:uncharacterized protein LOC141631493 n=1 Tax=Silene latifolia TaxID=37657 RepID=UPI003D777A96
MEVIECEIRQALFSMGSHKSPGQDGFSAQYFKTNWDIIKSDLCSAVREFFKKGTMPKQANTTLLSLIPKKQVVNTVMDNRPIACCTVLYKTISKILCDRLKGYRQQGISPICLIKVDIRKAFDSLKWTFVDQMLQEFNFPPQFQKWIMGYITFTWFSLKINSDTVGLFEGENDDLMLFVRDDVPSVKGVTQTLDVFAQLSGLYANPDKTNIYMGGVSEEIQHAILEETNYVQGDFPFRNFLWGTEEGQRKLIMKSWTSCCKPHIEGGFNIKEMLAWNKCILCKWIWAIETHSDSSWVLWNHTYNIKQNSFWTMQIKSFHSESWKSILKVRDLLLDKTGGIENARTLLSSCAAGGKLKLSLIYEQLREHDSRISWVKAI